MTTPKDGCGKCPACRGEITEDVAKEIKEKVMPLMNDIFGVLTKSSHGREPLVAATAMAAVAKITARIAVETREDDVDEATMRERMETLTDGLADSAWSVFHIDHLVKTLREVRALLRTMPTQPGGSA